MKVSAANDDLSRAWTGSYGKLAALFGLVLLAACAGSGPPVNVERTVVGADESPLVFADIQTPPLHGTFYDLRTSSQKAGGIIGVWSGRTKYPHARIVYTYLSPGYYYAREWDSDDYLDDLKLGPTTTFVRGEGGDTVNLLGRVSYRRFKSESSECVAFSQQFGPARRSTGDKKVAGHYCQAPGTRLSDPTITRILNGIGVRGIAVPAAIASTGTEWKLYSHEMLISGSWDNHYDSITGKFISIHESYENTGKILLTLPGDNGECVGKWFFDARKSPDDGQANGDWSVVCTNGLTIEGTYWIKGSHGGATGADQDGNNVNLTFARRAASQ